MHDPRFPASAPHSTARGPRIPADRLPGVGSATFRVADGSGNRIVHRHDPGQTSSRRDVASAMPDFAENPVMPADAPCPVQRSGRPRPDPVRPRDRLRRSCRGAAHAPRLAAGGARADDHHRILRMRLPWAQHANFSKIRRNMAPPGAPPLSSGGAPPPVARRRADARSTAPAQRRSDIR